MVEGSWSQTIRTRVNPTLKKNLRGLLAAESVLRVGRNVLGDLREENARTHRKTVRLSHEKADHQVTEDPVETIVVPAETTEAPAVMIEDPVETIVAPAVMIVVPVVTTEDPVVMIEDPAVMIEDPVETTEDPAETTEDPAVMTEAPVETTEDPGATRVTPVGEINQLVV